MDELLDAIRCVLADELHGQVAGTAVVRVYGVGEGHGDSWDCSFAQDTVGSREVVVACEKVLAVDFLVGWSFAGQRTVSWTWIGTAKAKSSSSEQFTHFSFLYLVYVSLRVSLAAVHILDGVDWKLDVDWLIAI
jgi:hypothetical protein